MGAMPCKPDGLWLWRMPEIPKTLQAAEAVTVPAVYVAKSMAATRKRVVITFHAACLPYVHLR